MVTLLDCFDGLHFEERRWSRMSRRVETLLANELGHYQPKVADRIVDFLVGGVQLSPLLLCNECRTYVAAKLLMVRRLPHFLYCFVTLELNIEHFVSFLKKRL